MDHHQFLLPWPRLLGGFRRKFPPSNLYGPLAGLKLIPDPECAVSFLSNPPRNAAPAMATAFLPPPHGNSWRLREPDGINLGVELSPEANPTRMAGLRKENP